MRTCLFILVSLLAVMVFTSCRNFSGQSAEVRVRSEVLSVTDAPGQLIFDVWLDGVEIWLEITEPEEYSGYGISVFVEDDRVEDLGGEMFLLKFEQGARVEFTLEESQAILRSMFFWEELGDVQVFSAQ